MHFIMSQHMGHEDSDSYTHQFSGAGAGTSHQLIFSGSHVSHTLNTPPGTERKVASESTPVLPASYTKYRSDHRYILLK